MTAREHTERMLLWWKRAGVLRADVAVRRSDGTMAWHHDLGLEQLPLGWIRAENAAKADVYIRPARDHSWPIVFLDDVAVAVAARATTKYAALVVATSPEGGCHLWLRCRRPLDEAQRRAAQRWLAQRIGADRGSTSGEHLGRLAGFKNWKRGGNWVNVLDEVLTRPAWQPAACAASKPFPVTPRAREPHGLRDSSESGREWGWVCGLLERGYAPQLVAARLRERAQPRRGDDAQRYAELTLRKALARVRSRELVR